MGAFDLGEAKAYLQKQAKQGSSLYNHLTEVVLKILQEKPEDALSVFENVSAGVKDARLQPEILRESPALPSDQPSLEQLKQWIDRTVALYKKQEKIRTGDDDEDEDEEEEPEVCHIPDIINEAHLFQWAGINIGRDESYKVLLSLRQLSKTEENIASIRFFGKIFGTSADYYIAECKLKEYPELEEENADPEMEVPGSGINEYVYYVSNELSGATWTRLPDLLPAQINTARNVRRFFTGDLNAKVLGHPRFPWKEAVYLRANVARIASSTVLAVAGFYENGEDDDDEGAPLEVSEEFEPKGSEDLISAESWVHLHRHILLQGRHQKLEKPEPDDDEDDEDAPPPPEPTPADLEEPQPRLRSIAEDSSRPAVPGSDEEEEAGSCWTFRVGSVAQKQHLPDTVVSAHSLLWPGAVSVAKSGTNLFASIYVGYGAKSLQERYTPPLPRTIQSEFVEFEPIDDEDRDEDEEIPEPVSILAEQKDPYDDGEGPSEPMPGPDDEEDFDDPEYEF